MGGRGAAGEANHSAVPQHRRTGIGGGEREERVHGGGLGVFTEGNRGLETHARGSVREQRNEAFGVGFRAGGVAEDFRGLRADFRVGISEQGPRSGDGRSGAAEELAVTPHGVHASEERRGGIAGDGEERFGLAAFGELELGALTDALIAVTEKGDEFSRSGFSETRAE